MPIDAWLPVGFELPDGAKIRTAILAAEQWQIYETAGDGRALVVLDTLAQRWLEAGLIDGGNFNSMQFGDLELDSISSAPSHMLGLVSEGTRLVNKSEALSFALMMKEMREIDPKSSLFNALYVEKITRLLPTYETSIELSDDVVLGHWLTGGAHISVSDFRQLHQSMNWLGAGDLKDIVEAAGFEVAELIPQGGKASGGAERGEMAQPGPKERNQQSEPRANKVFELAGRSELTDFFNEHIIDIILNRDRYRALGIEFPSAVILHGPPGCGKTFAVEQLVAFLGWPSFQIDASSIASPYIHETSKKIAEVFDKAMESAPSVLVLDEMEAFLAEREMGSSHHRVEEMAEFLRRIPEAVKNDILIIAMTNRIEMIDQAIQRRGRFDHVIKVDFASEVEVRALLEKLLSSLPREADVDPRVLAKALAGRPLSDVSFVVREGARLAARSNKTRLDQESLLSALREAPARKKGDSKTDRRIGFV